ncbi:MAG: hypothetical protein DA330_00070 [Nitrososphaera sp.]|nr:hypothetical protein [Nitrososphaera sp.]
MTLIVYFSSIVSGILDNGLQHDGQLSIDSFPNTVAHQKQDSQSPKLRWLYFEDGTSITK